MKHRPVIKTRSLKRFQTERSTFWFPVCYLSEVWLYFDRCLCLFGLNQDWIRDPALLCKEVIYLTEQFADGDTSYFINTCQTHYKRAITKIPTGSHSRKMTAIYICWGWSIPASRPLLELRDKIFGPTLPISSCAPLLERNALPDFRETPWSRKLCGAFYPRRSWSVHIWLGLRAGGE